MLYVVGMLPGLNQSQMIYACSKPSGHESQFVCIKEYTDGLLAFADSKFADGFSSETISFCSIVFASSLSYWQQPCRFS